MHDTSLYSTERSGERARQREREKEREQVKSERQRKGCGMGHKLDYWSSNYEGLEKE